MLVSELVKKLLELPQEKEVFIQNRTAQEDSEICGVRHFSSGVYIEIED